MFHQDEVTDYANWKCALTMVTTELCNYENSLKVSLDTLYNSIAETE